MASLAQIEARERAQLLAVESYRIALDVTGVGDTFLSTTTVRFTASRPGADTFIELRPSRLRVARLNGVALDPAALVDGRLPLRSLAAQNTLRVEAEMAYSHEGLGLNRYRDPADGRTYLYSQAAPDAAPQLFACFDQPDLKARLAITVTAPEDWIVLGTGVASRTGPGRWELAETPPLPTYLAAVVAGPYVSIHDTGGEVPLGLHCRASLGESLRTDAAELFEITRRCMAEFQTLFGTPYAFGKFDQVFVPEFANLAMENPACVLIRDQRLFSSSVSTVDREDRAVIIAHEMSHMWFGNLVTMGWWDDLWLNEAFADFMGHRTATEATRFTGALTSFSAGRKGLAYAADQRSSTHPLSGDVPDLAAALTYFDHISYFKGSSVVRQLAAFVGEEAFRAGLHTYFARHRFGNARYADFLAAMQDSSGRDLVDWGERWLRAANVTTLTPEFTVVDGRITAAAIGQTAPASHPVLRPHALALGLYPDEGPPDTVRVLVDGARTELPALVGRPAPRFVLLNQGDLSYAKVRLDPASMAALPQMLPRLAPLDRAMLWGDLLLAVQDAAFPARRYLELVADMVRAEAELPILTEVLQRARTEVADRYLDPAERPAMLGLLADRCRGLLAGLAPGDERALIVLRTLIDISTDVGELRGPLADDPLPAGLALDAHLRWRLTYRLAILGELEPAEIDAARAADRSTEGEHWAAKCQAALPAPAGKRETWQALTAEPDLPHYRARALAEGFWQPEQAAATEEYADLYFVDLPAAAKLRGDLVADNLAHLLFPRYTVATRIVELAERLAAATDAPVTARRRIADHADDLRRVIAARAARW
jgi:aminopeptidase N